MGSDLLKNESLANMTVGEREVAKANITNGKSISIKDALANTYKGGVTIPSDSAMRDANVNDTIAPYVGRPTMKDYVALNTIQYEKDAQESSVTDIVHQVTGAPYADIKTAESAKYYQTEPGFNRVTDAQSAVGLLTVGDVTNRFNETAKLKTSTGITLGPELKLNDTLIETGDTAKYTKDDLGIPMVNIGGSTTEASTKLSARKRMMAKPTPPSKIKGDADIFYSPEALEGIATIGELYGRVAMAGHGRFGGYTDAYNTAVLDGYNRHKIINPALFNGARKAHVFLTVPDCHIFDTNGFKGLSSTIRENDATLRDVIQSDPTMVRLATFLDANRMRGVNSSSVQTSLFIYPLMNLLKSLNGLPNYDMKTSTGPANMRNNTSELAVDAFDSLSNNTVTLTFHDDRKGTVMRMMYMWLRYMEDIRQGIIEPSKASIQNFVLDYTCSIYIFITDETNKNLVYWFKLNGCFPKGRSYDFLNVTLPDMNDRGDISIPFKVTIPEDMNISILSEFNYLNNEFYKHVEKGATERQIMGDQNTRINSKGVLDLTKMTNQADYYVDRFYISKYTDRSNGSNNIDAHSGFRLNMFSSVWDTKNTQIHDAIADLKQKARALTQTATVTY